MMDTAPVRTFTDRRLLSPFSGLRPLARALIPGRSRRANPLIDRRERPHAVVLVMVGQFFNRHDQTRRAVQAALVSRQDEL